MSPPCVEFTTYACSFTQTCNDVYRIYSSKTSLTRRIRRVDTRRTEEGGCFFYVGHDEEY